MCDNFMDNNYREDYPEIRTNVTKNNGNILIGV